MVLEKTLAIPLDSKEIKPVSSEGNQPRIFIRRTDAEAEAPILESESDSWSGVSDSVIPWIIQSVEFSRPEHWSG